MIVNVGAGGAGNALSVKYDNAESGLVSDNVQGALDEVNNNLGGLRFGVDGDGNYGYYGADDSLIPFKSGGFLENYYEMIPLYVNGDECTDLTGGWETVTYHGTVTKNENSITMYGTNTNNNSPVVIQNAKAIDLSGVIGLFAVISDKRGTSVSYISTGISLKTAKWTTGTSNGASTSAITNFTIRMNTNTDAQVGIFGPSINTNGISGFVEVRCNNNNGFTVKEIYLLKDK